MGFPTRNGAAGFRRRSGARPSAGRTQVTVDVRQGQIERRMVLRIERLDGVTWWLVAGSLFFAGALFLLAGLVALWASPGSRLARTFAVFASRGGASSCSPSSTTTRRTGWCRSSSSPSPCFPGALCMLALRLPDDAPVLRRYPWLERADRRRGWRGGAALRRTVPARPARCLSAPALAERLRRQPACSSF